MFMQPRESRVGSFFLLTHWNWKVTFLDLAGEWCQAAYAAWPVSCISTLNFDYFDSSHLISIDRRVNLFLAVGLSLMLCELCQNGGNSRNYITSESVWNPNPPHSESIFGVPQKLYFSCFLHTVCVTYSLNSDDDSSDVLLTLNPDVELVTIPTKGTYRANPIVLILTTFPSMIMKPVHDFRCPHAQTI